MLTVIIPTIGRASLKRLLRSLDCDKVIVVSDDRHNAVARMVAGYPCTHIRNPARLGYWGHASRNKVQSLVGEGWLMFADDDNWYLPGAFAYVRKTVVAGSLNLYRVQTPGGIVWKEKEVRIGNVDTGCGVVEAGVGVEWGLRYEGDGDYYVEVAKRMPVTFHDKVIYQMGSRIGSRIPNPKD